MKSKFALAFILVFVAVFSISLFSNARADDWYEYNLPDINEMTVYVNGEMVWYGYCYYDPLNLTDRWKCVTSQHATPALEREETAEVKVTFIANDDFEETKVKVWVGGYYDDIEAETPLFDVFAGNTYTKTLDLYVPKDIDARDTYTLHVDIQQKHDLSGTGEADIETEIQRIANWIEIMSVKLYDSGHYYGYCGECTMTFEAGTTIYADIVVKNRGNHEAEDVYVHVSINDLCLERTVYLGDLGASDDDDEDAKSVTIALMIPLDAFAGTYTLEVKAYNDEVSDVEFRNIQIEGPGKKEKEEEKEGEVVITPQITSNEIQMGKGEVYTILVANFGDNEEDFVVSVLGTEGGCEGETACTGWAEVTINPQAFSLKPGESQLVNVYVAAAENAIEGEHVFSVKVEHDGKAEQFSMVANIVKGEGEKMDLKTILLIIGIILIAAVIVLLILLLTGKKATEKSEIEESYY